MIYFAKNSGQKPGTASLEYPLFHGSLPPYGYQAVTNVDFAGLNDYFYSPTGWETFILSSDRKKEAERLACLEEELQKTEEDMKQIIRYSHIEELNQEVVDIFLKKVYAYRDKRIEIEWNFRR